MKTVVCFRKLLLHFHNFCLCNLCLKILDLAAKSDVGYWSCDEDRRQCTEYNTEQHCEREAACALTAEAEDTEQHDECRERCIDSTCEGLVQRVVEEVLQVVLLVQLEVLADTVEYHHLVVDRVTDNGKDGADECLVYLKREWNNVPKQ